MADESNLSLEKDLNPREPQKSGIVIRMFWEQEVPAVIIAEENNAAWSDGLILFQRFVKLILTGFALAGLWIFFCVQFVEYHNGPLYAGAIVAVVIGIIIYWKRRPRRRTNWFALTNREIMMFTSRTTPEDLQNYLDNVRPAVNTALDTADLAVGIATVFTDFSAQPNVGHGLSNLPKADHLMEYSDILKLELRTAENAIIARSKDPRADSINIFCQSSDHMDEVLNFLKKQSPLAAV